MFRASDWMLVGKGSLLVALVCVLVWKGALPALHAVTDDFPANFTSAKIVRNTDDAAKLYDWDWFREQMRRYEVGTPEHWGKFVPYPPPTALVLTPLANLQPLTALRVVTALNLVWLACSILLLHRIFGWRLLDAALLVLSSGWALQSGLRFGHPYILISTLSLLGYALYLKGRPFLAGLCLGLFVPVKYYPLIILAGFGLHRHWRLVLGGVVAIAAVVLFSIAVMGWQVHQVFLTEVLFRHLSGHLETVPSFTPVAQSFDTLFSRLFLFDPLRNPYPLLVSPLGRTMGVIAVKAVLVSIAVAALVNPVRNNDVGALSATIGILGALVFLIAPASTTYSCILLLLPVALLIQHCTQAGLRMLACTLVAIYALIGIIPYGHTIAFDGRGGLTVLAYPRLFLMLTLFATAICAVGCNRSSKPLASRDPSLIIELRWIKSYPGQSRSDAETGLYWALSFLGAKLPSEATIVAWHETRMTLDLDAATTATGTEPAWRKLLQVLKSSDEYRRMGAVDMGRFVFLTLCSPQQYYALTGVSPTYEGFRAAHAFSERQMAIIESGVARGNRLIEIGEGDSMRSVAFVAFEGSGSLVDHSFQKRDIETLDLMENGQLRFGLYDLEGHLKDTTTPALTDAGKPSKCLWCHEINLQPPFKNVTDVAGYTSSGEFRELVTHQMQIITTYRKTLASKIDFNQRQAHSNAENLYLSFAEPTAARLAEEWNRPLAEVEQLLASRNLKTHSHSARVDDAILGDALYDRNKVDSLAPYATIRGPSDMREASEYEPSLLK